MIYAYKITIFTHSKEYNQSKNTKKHKILNDHNVFFLIFPNLLRYNQFQFFITLNASFSGDTSLL
ncbi:hypothetical protein M2347_003223 [Chryseobacterium sp. H1D6B]|nr:hypothetical protein [Chryseobacterium sp. H1D6B]